MTDKEIKLITQKLNEMEEGVEEKIEMYEFLTHLMVREQMTNGVCWDSILLEITETVLEMREEQRIERNKLN